MSFSVDLHLLAINYTEDLYLMIELESLLVWLFEMRRSILQGSEIGRGGCLFSSCLRMHPGLIDLYSQFDSSSFSSALSNIVNLGFFSSYSSRFGFFAEGWWIRGLSCCSCSLHRRLVSGLIASIQVNGVFSICTYGCACSSISFSYFLMLLTSIWQSGWKAKRLGCAVLWGFGMKSLGQLVCLRRMGVSIIASILFNKFIKCTQVTTHNIACTTCDISIHLA